MIEITDDMEPTHDLNANISGFIQSRVLRLYEKEDIIPTMDKWIDPPLLMIEEIDEKSGEYKPPKGYDGDPIILMKPVDAIAITKEQAEFFKKHFGE